MQMPKTTVAIAVSKSSGRGVYGDWSGPGGFIDPRFVQGCARAEVQPFEGSLGPRADQACAAAEADRFGPGR